MAALMRDLCKSKARLVYFGLCAGLTCVTSCGIPKHSIEAAESASGSEPTMAAPAARVIAEILRRGGLNVAHRAIMSSFNAKTADQPLKILNRYRTDPTQVSGAMQQLNRAACFSIHLTGQLRMVLNADKTTVLFAGSHEAYNKFLNSSSLKRLCGNK